MAGLEGHLIASTRRGYFSRRYLPDAGFSSMMRMVWLPVRAFASQNSAAKVHQQKGLNGVGVRKRMVPLIKLVHPDLFAQYHPDVAKTNQKSLKDLNTLIDATEALETAAAAVNGSKFNGIISGSSLPSVDPIYRLTFYHYDDPTGTSTPPHEGDAASQDGEDWNDSALGRLHAELRFPQALSRDPAASLLDQLRRQLAELLRRVPREAQGEDVRDKESIEAENLGKTRGKGYEWGTGAEGKESFFRDHRTAPPRSGIRTERESHRDSHSRGPRTRKELEQMILQHAGEHVFDKPKSSQPGLGAGFFDGGLAGANCSNSRSSSNAATSPSWKSMNQRRRSLAIWEERSRKVDDLLRSGRVQFAGVPIAREAEALVRLHQAFVNNFDHLELHDKGLWSTVILVLRGKSRDYQVQAHTGGPIFIVPEEFSEKNLMKFLGETLLSHA